MLDILIISSCIVAAWWVWSMRMPKNFPPGPKMPLPLIGDSYRMSSGSVTASIKDMQKKYGNVFGFYLTSNWRVVFVCDAQLINEVAYGNDFTQRYNKEMWRRIRGGVSLGKDIPGVLFSSNQTWVEQRRFCLSNLRDFGFGKQTMEEFISEELDKCTEFLDDKSMNGKKALFPKEVLGISVINSLWRMLNGTTFDQNDEKLLGIVHKLHFFISQFSKMEIQLGMQYRVLEEILEGLDVTQVHKAFKSMYGMAEEAVEDHVDNFDESVKPADFIEAYLAKINSETDPNSSFHGEDGKLNLKNCLMDLFIAGVETTTTSLTWAIYFMVKHPEIQERVQRELDENLGRDKMPRLSDKASTPYTEAVIHEIQRRGNVLPLSVSHVSPPDRITKIGNYEIPPYTEVFLTIGAVHDDPEVFDNPLDFNPDRFIEGGEFKAHPKVIPFGIGKRRCLGESLAKAQLYLYFARILQLYKLEAKTELTDETDEGFVVCPKRFEVAFIRRD